MLVDDSGIHFFGGTEAERLLFLGNMLHSTVNSTYLEDWFSVDLAGRTSSPFVRSTGRAAVLIKRASRACYEICG